MSNPIDREHAAERSPLLHRVVAGAGGGVDDRNCGQRADGTRAVVVGDLVARLQVVQGHALAPRDHRAEDAVAGEKRCVANVVGPGRELADPEVRPGVVQPEEHGGVEIEGAPQEIERVVHGDVNLLDARSREPIGA